MSQVACPGCQKSYELPESASGRTANCKGCGTSFKVVFATQQARVVEDPDEYELEEAEQSPPPSPTVQVKCTWCEKIYDAPNAAVGMVVPCSCGKKFRVGGQATHEVAGNAVGAMRQTPAHLLRSVPLVDDRSPAAAVQEKGKGHAKGSIGRAGPERAPQHEEEPDRPVLRAIDIGYRVTCVVVSLVLWVALCREMVGFQTNHLQPDSPLLYVQCFSALPIFLIVGGFLAYMGINYRAGSGEIRRNGLNNLGIGVLATVMLIAANYTALAILGPTILQFLLGFPLAAAQGFFAYGLFQIVTGHKIGQDDRT